MFEQCYNFIIMVMR